MHSMSFVVHLCFRLYILYTISVLAWILSLSRSLSFSLSVCDIHLMWRREGDRGGEESNKRCQLYKCALKNEMNTQNPYTYNPRTISSGKSLKCTEAQALHTACYVKWNYLECLDSNSPLQHLSDMFIVLTAISQMLQLYCLNRENICVAPLVTLFLIVFFFFFNMLLSLGQWL